MFCIIHGGNDKDRKRRKLKQMNLLIGYGFLTRKKIDIPIYELPWDTPTRKSPFITISNLNESTGSYFRRKFHRNRKLQVATLSHKKLRIKIGKDIHTNQIYVYICFKNHYNTLMSAVSTGGSWHAISTLFTRVTLLSLKRFICNTNSRPNQF